MKKFIALLMLSFLVVGCGSNSSSAPAPKGPTAAQPASSYGKWDANTVSAFDQYCAAAGDSNLSYQQWYLYCDCIAQFSSQWSFDDFAYNVDYYIYNVILQPAQNGVSPDTACLQKAGATSRPQTTHEIESAEII